MPESTIESLIEGGKATAGPPIGPALGPTGINIGEVVKAINEKTKEFAGMQVPVKVIINSADKSFRIEIGTPPVSALIKKEIGLEKGSGSQKADKVADIPMQVAVKVARMKKDNMLARTLKAATKEVLGTCVSLGVLVEGMDPREAQKAIDRGDYDALFNEGANLSYDKEAVKKRMKELQALIKPKEEAVPEGKEAAPEAAKAPGQKGKPKKEPKGKTKSLAKASSAKKK